jgi:hypothetical protein
VAFIKEVPLRRTVDIVKPSEPGQTHDAASSPEATGSPSSAARRGGEAGTPAAGAADDGASRRAAVRAALAGREGEAVGLDGELQLLLAEAESASSSAERAGVAGVPDVAVLQETQRLLAAQQVQLGQLFSRVADQLEVQQRIAAEQGQTAKAQAETAASLAELQAELAAERQLQKEAALYLATRGRHTAT